MPNIQQIVAGLMLTIAIAVPVQAEVWKCSLDGKLQYSDQPCQSQGAPMAPRSLQSNVIETAADGPAAMPTATERQTAAMPGRGGQLATSVNVCPTDSDIASMETKASSITLSPESKRFVQDEIRRARQCQKGRGNYSAADWAISKEAIEAQSSTTGAADARRRSETMHSAADPSEGELIARQRAIEDREALRRQRTPFAR